MEKERKQKDRKGNGRKKIRREWEVIRMEGKKKGAMDRDVNGGEKSEGK